MPADKLLHAVLWAIGAGLAAIFAWLVGWPMHWTSLILGALTAGAWELFQKYAGRGFPSWGDFLTGSTSSAVVALATYLNT